VWQQDRVGAAVRDVERGAEGVREGVDQPEAPPRRGAKTSPGGSKVLI
jgi:hypothetical protein